MGFWKMEAKYITVDPPRGRKFCWPCEEEHDFAAKCTRGYGEPR